MEEEESKKRSLEMEVRQLESRILQQQNSPQINEEIELIEDEDTDRGIYLQLLKNIEREISERHAMEKKQKKELNDLQAKLAEKKEEENSLRKSFQDFRQSIVSNFKTDTRIVQLVSKECLKLSEITKARMSFLRSKLKVKKLERKAAEKEASGIDEIGFEQMKASFEDLREKNHDREREIIRYRTIQKEYLSERKAGERMLEESKIILQNKKKLVEQMDEEIHMKRKKKDNLDRKMKNKIDLLSDANVCSHEELKIVENHHLKSSQELEELKKEIKRLKERHTELTRIEC
jgi:hypothetical protein